MCVLIDHESMSTEAKILDSRMYYMIFRLSDKVKSIQMADILLNCVF